MQQIEEFLTYLSADRGFSPLTVTTYRKALENFKAFADTLPEPPQWDTLDADVVRLWMAHEMKRGCSGRYLNKQLSALRTFCRYRMRTGHTDSNPLRFVKSPKAHTPLPTFLKDSEVNRLFDDVYFGEDFRGQRDRLVLLTFYHTGIRRAELMGLNLADIDLARCELKVTGKRNKQRIVPFGRELQQALETYLPLRAELAPETEHALFLNDRGHRMGPSLIYETVHRYLSLVTTQKKKSPHVLRHTFATTMLNNGADLEAIRDLLGHESIQTTEVYTHTTFADLKKEYEHAHPRA